MTNSDSKQGSDSPILGENLLKLLGNDTRMQILQALWAEFDFERYVIREQIALSFSELLARVDTDDSGNLNYHLGKLIGPFIENEDEGYVLTPLGYNLMRSITTYASFNYRTFEPTELDDSCPFCGGVLLAKYERELVHTYCRDCEGLAGGNITSVNLPSIDVNQRDISAILDAASIQLQTRVRSLSYGLCGRCHGQVEASIAVCEQHTHNSKGICEDCGLRFGTEITVECNHCGASGVGPLVESAIVAPQVESFFGDHNRGPRDIGPFRYRLTALEAVDETICGSNPVEVVYSFSLERETERVRILKNGNTLQIQSINDTS